jgi:hypothetical protein
LDKTTVDVWIKLRPMFLKKNGSTFFGAAGEQGYLTGENLCPFNLNAV